MKVDSIIAEIDDQLQKLQQARNLLSALGSTPSKGPGRPKSINGVSRPKARKLTPEGRRRIQEAAKRRWAKRRRDEKATSKAK